MYLRVFAVGSKGVSEQVPGLLLNFNYKDRLIAYAGFDFMPVMPRSGHEDPLGETTWLAPPTCPILSRIFPIC